MPAHHACSTYVLSLYPRFNLWSRLLPSTSTKVASTIVSCDLQSRLWMLLYSGLCIAELTRTSLTNTWNRGTRGTEEHEEHENTRNTRTREEAKKKSMPWPHSTLTKGVTHQEYKRGQSAQLWRGTKYNLLHYSFLRKKDNAHIVFWLRETSK